MAESVEMSNVEIKGIPNGFLGAEYSEVLSADALNFVAKLQKNFNQRRKDLLEARVARQLLIDAGVKTDFLEETKHIREGDWSCAPLPDDLQDRRVEITGPVSAKMIINALNSGANVFMTDFEDASSPTWTNMIAGQINLRKAIDKTLEFVSYTGREYRLKEKIATLMVRPRGWHLEDKNLLIDGENVSASLMDFGLFFFHNAQKLIDNGTGPYFYLPKLENHQEARLWNDVFVFAQNELGIAQGTIKATVLIETILAAFEMDEILYELKEHSAGLNCGRWDYIFSYIKKFRRWPEFILPDRHQVGMHSPFMSAYSMLLIQTCHKRHVHAMGGMAAQIPIKNDLEANAKAMDKVKEDKLREVHNGHDGTWVAHPGLIPMVREIFDEFMPTPNHIEVKREDVKITNLDLLEDPIGEITEAGLRNNVDVAIHCREV